MRTSHIIGAIVGSLLCVFAVIRIFHREVSVKRATETAENELPVQAPYERRRDWSSGQQEPAQHPTPFNYAPPPTSADHVSFTQPEDSDPRAQVAEVMARLKASGPGTADLDSRARNVFDTWKQGSQLATGVTFKDPECFAGGCSIVAEYSDLGSYINMSRDFESSKAFLLWSRPKFRSAPTPTESGHVEATWVLMK
jgi:hypothetical protein